MTLFKGKKWAFLYKTTKEYPYHYGESLFLNILKEEQIFSEKTFKEHFKIIYSQADKPYYIRDIDILIANFNPWEGVPEYYNAYSFDYTSFELPSLDNETVVEELLSQVQSLLDSALKECPKCLTKEQITTLRKFIANRSSKEGKEFVLTQKLQERMNFMAAFQLLGAYDKYYYSVKDIQKRSFLADNHWLGEITTKEKAGQASAIDIKEGYQQYVAYYDTNSAFFLGFQYLKMYGDLLDIAVANKAINESQRILSKNFKKVWGKGIGNAGKVTKIQINEDLKKLLSNEDYRKIYNDFVTGKIERKFTKELSLEEEAVLKFYTNKSYYKFNQALISGNKTNDVIEIEKLLNKTLDKIPSSSGTFYRGIGKEEIQMLSKYKIGDEITYKNFLSTSSERDIAIKFLTKNNLKTQEASLIIVKGKKGKLIREYSDAPLESEILFKNGSKFKLEKVEESKLLNSFQHQWEFDPAIYWKRIYNNRN